MAFAVSVSPKIIYAVLIAPKTGYGNYGVSVSASPVFGVAVARKAGYGGYGVAVSSMPVFGVGVAVKPYVIVPFAPSDIAGLKLWVQADAITGLNDGDPVGTWQDQSGQSNHLTQATANKKPLYKTNILNGKPAVRFDGADDFLQKAFTLAQPNHIFVVAIQRGFNQYARLFDGAAAKNTVSQWSGDPVTTLYLEAASYQVTSLTWTTNAAHVPRAKFDGASSALALDSGSYEVKNIGVTSAGGLTLCADKDGAYVGRFDICEVLVYDSILSSGDEANVMEYLNGRWAVY